MQPRILPTFALLAPFAALLAAPAPAAAAPSCSGPVCQDAASWTDGGFGASYSFWTGLQSKKNFQTDASYGADYLKMGADIHATAKAFGVSKPIVDAYALAYHNNGESWGGVHVAAVGVVLYSESITNAIPFGVSRTFFKADEDISLLGVHIDLDGKVGGELGVDVTPSITSSYMSLMAEPYARAYADADADVGAACASVAVKGSLTALDLHVPAVITATYPEDNSMSVLMSLDYSLHSLDGKLKVELEYCMDSDSKTLVNFDGFTAGGQLFAKWGNISW
ncbi:hypothetical protein [Polyangium jinanense]|uniref:Uncharacterized protein n=1 Tax=Polyangium jinanense TaxID=2829994 RepID=A0A9X3XEI4_9BACT|nr:hypothetical protein [Polyangium jinanense]MDC3962008.1 hypothetical protein [Polyangium jinanense]MDC3988904.1 hypothetical protein [Polyangium jinanense]